MINQMMSLELKIGIALAITLFCGYHLSQAGENYWTTAGPTGGRVFTIAINPIDRSQIYIGTVEGGIYKTTDGGEDWQRLNAGNLPFTIREIQIHPLAPETLYAATIDGLFKSDDFGNSWIFLEPPFGEFNEFDCIKIYPSDPSIIFAGTGGAGFKSVDGGRNWSSMDVHLVSVITINFDPLEENVLYITTHSAPTRHSILRSEDLGESWYSVHNNLDTAAIVTDLAIDPTDNQILYLSLADIHRTSHICAAKSTDHGRSWFDITPPDLLENHAYDILVSPSDHNAIYLCTRQDGVLISGDGGATWQRSNDGLNVRQIKCIEADHINNLFYLGTFHDGIYKSNDHGATWHKISSNIYRSNCLDIAANWRHPDSLFLAAANGLFISTDGAQGWTRQTIPGIDPNKLVISIELDRLHPEKIYASESASGPDQPKGILRSWDGGATWQLFEDWLPPGSYPHQVSIAYLDDSNRRLFVAATSGVYYSDDYGESWERSAGLPPNRSFYRIGVSPADPSLVFAAGYNIEEYWLYRSTDCGQTWERIEGFPPAFLILEITFHPIDPDILYICILGVGLCVSYDRGQNWSSLNSDLPFEDSFYGATGLAINPENTQNLFINSAHRGFFTSHDAGQHWLPLNDSLDLTYMAACTLVDPLDADQLFIATQSGSAWTLSRTATSISDNIQAAPPKLKANLYPNPFNESARISFAVADAGDVKIKIYDMLGRQVAALADEYFNSGSYHFNWQPREIASGRYFLTIRTQNQIFSQKILYLR